jgi:DNA polymerase I
VAKKHPVNITTLPNVRKIFIPDPGFTIIEADLSGADALVVAREANDLELERDITSGIDLHSKNATDLFGEEFTRLPKGALRHELRQSTKQGVHATNYGAVARTLAIILGWTITRADTFQRRWFTKHPGIYEWHRRTERQLSEDRTIRNAFGYRRVYFDRIESVLGQALAWTPQSTVAETCFRGGLRVRKLSYVQLLLQVHDSLVFQLPTPLVREKLPEIKRALENPVPYPDRPLVIPWKLKASAKSWGDCEDIAA